MSLVMNVDCRLLGQELSVLLGHKVQENRITVLKVFYTKKVLKYIVFIALLPIFVRFSGFNCNTVCLVYCLLP